MRQLVAGETTEHVADGAAVPVAVAGKTSDEAFANVNVVELGTDVIV